MYSGFPVRAIASKTRQPRLVEICSSLAAWLEPFKGATGRVWSQTPTPQGAVAPFARLRESLEIPPRRNGLRHGFVSFHFAMHQNENQTAAQAGNSPAMIHAHYKGLATRTEAEKWFAVVPAKSAKNIISLAAASGKGGID